MWRSSLTDSWTLFSAMKMSEIDVKTRMETVFAPFREPFLSQIIGTIELRKLTKSPKSPESPTFVNVLYAERISYNSRSPEWHTSFILFMGPWQTEWKPCRSVFEASITKSNYWHVLSTWTIEKLANGWSQKLLYLLLPFLRVVLFILTHTKLHISTQH